MSFNPLNSQQRLALTQQLVSEGTIVDPSSAKGLLLKAAATLFREKGFDRTTVRELAKEIGILSGSLFHHYASKQEILRNVMEQTILLNTARMELALSQNDSTKDKLHALILCELQAILIDTGAEMAVLVYEWRALNPENQELILELRDHYESLWLGVLESAYQEGIITVAPSILRRLLAGAISWSINWYKHGGELSLVSLSEMTLSLAVKE